MTRVWVTNGSTTVEGVVNPVAAACEQGFVPETVRLLANPGIEAAVAEITDLLDAILTAYGVDDPAIEVHEIQSETDFPAIVEHFRDGIAAAHGAHGADGSHGAGGGPVAGGAPDAPGEVAVDVTPGRKFMSAIALQVGLREGADHVFYLHVPGEYFQRLYSTIPRTGVELYDFTEVF